MTVDENRNLTLSWLILLLLTLIWGSSFILIKRGLDHFDAGEVGALRMFSASVVLLPLAIRWFRKLTKQQYLYLFIVGFIGSFLPAFLFAKAETGISSAVAGVLNALTPVSVIIIGGLFFRQRFTFRTGFGVFVGLIGTIILMLASSEGDAFALNYFALYVLVATICYGLNVNVIKYKLHGVPAIPLTAMAFTLILPFSVIYLFGYSDFTAKIAANPEAWRSVFYISLLGVFGTAAAMVLFNKMIQFISPVFASSVTYLIPIVAVIWGLLDGESLVFLHYMAMVIILVGVYITNRK